MDIAKAITNHLLNERVEKRFLDAEPSRNPHRLFRNYSSAQRSSTQGPNLLTKDALEQRVALFLIPELFARPRELSRDISQTPPEWRPRGLTFARMEMMLRNGLSQGSVRGCRKKILGHAQTRGLNAGTYRTLAESE